MTNTKYQVLARRYRPKAFSEVVGQEPAVTTLKNALRFDQAAHAYLFCGSRGVGKTTLARLFAKALNCQERGEDMEPCNRCSSCLEIGTSQSLDVIEIDGASNRGIDDIRQINETVLYSPTGRYKIYIIDEVHMLTKEAFNALLKTLEEPPEKAKFFFATTEPHKVLPTIISRCQRFDLGRIQLSQIIAKLEEIAADLGRQAEPEALHLIAAFSDGSLRDAESLFDQILCFAENKVTAAAVRASLGLIPQEHFFALDQAFSEARAAFAFEMVETLFASGKDLTHFYEQLMEHVRNLASARLLGEAGLSLPSELKAKTLQSARLYAPSQCLYLLEYLLRAEPSFQKSACQRVALESILLHYIQSKHRIPVEVLVRRLMEMEEALKSRSGPLPKPPLEEGPKIEPAPEIAPAHDSSLKPQPLPQQMKESPAKHPLPEPAPPPEHVAKIETPAPRPPVSLKPVPFNPFKKAEVAKASGGQSKPQPALAEPPPPKQAQPQPTPPEPAKPEPPRPQAFQEPKKPEAKGPILPQSQSRYDTLMRFATVELEGTLKIT